MIPPLRNIDSIPITAGWRYSSGSGHFAYDWDSDTGTPCYAIGDGTILGSADGSPNDKPGDPNYSGEPSNWILLGTMWKGKRVSALYQHLSPGLKVHTGQHVKEGHLLGRTGNSGNSTGDHLHFATMFGHWDAATRYIYMQNDGNNPYVIFPPTDLWKDQEMALTNQELNDIAERTVDKLMRRKLFGDKAAARLKDATVQDALRRTYMGHNTPEEV
jgi:murein DD-endopeptidase MepM/ murein hydrolase activator NlpD